MAMNSIKKMVVTVLICGVVLGIAGRVADHVVNAADTPAHSYYVGVWADIYK